MFSLAQAAKAPGKSRPDDRAGDQERPTFPPAAPMTAATRSIRPNWPRVFTLAGHDPGPMKHSVPPTGAEASPAISVGEAESLDARIAEQAETIRNLWQRLDAEGEERRRVQERLTGLLTHRQAAGSVPLVQKTETASVARVPWWRRWR